jgi:hypothetical protein
VRISLPAIHLIRDKNKNVKGTKKTQPLKHQYPNEEMSTGMKQGILKGRGKNRQ